MNHQSLQILLLSLTFKQHFLKTFRPPHMTAHSPYLSSEFRGGGTESHPQSVWEKIAGGWGRTAEGISDSGWEFRGRKLSINHSVPAFQVHSFLLKYFKQHCFEAHGWLMMTNQWWYRGSFQHDKLELGIGVSLCSVNPLHFPLKYVLLSTFILRHDQWFSCMLVKMYWCPQGGFVFLFFTFCFQWYCTFCFVVVVYTQNRMICLFLISTCHHCEDLWELWTVERWRQRSPKQWLGGLKAWKGQRVG